MPNEFMPERHSAKRNLCQKAPRSYFQIGNSFRQMNCIIPKLSNQFSFSNTDSEMDGGNHIILQPQLCTIYMQYYLFNSSQNCYTIYKPPILKTGGAFAAPQSTTTTTSTQQRSTTTAGPYVDEQNQWRLERRERRPKQLKACQKCRAQPQ